MKTKRSKTTVQRTGHAGGVLLINLTLDQTERIAKGEALSDVLSKKVRAFVAPYLSDPDYHIAINRLNKKSPGVVMIALNVPNAETTLSHKAAQIVEHLAHASGITVNRFINIAIAEKLEAMKGGE